MIRIELQVSTVSLCAFISAAVPVPPAVLGVLLTCRDRTVTSGVASGSLILNALVLVLSGVFPEEIWLLSGDVVTSLMAFVCGLCYISLNTIEGSVAIVFAVFVFVDSVIMTAFATFWATQQYVMLTCSHQEQTPQQQEVQEKQSQQTLLSPKIKAHHRSDSTLSRHNFATSSTNCNTSPTTFVSSPYTQPINEFDFEQQWNGYAQRLRQASTSTASDMMIPDSAGFVPSRVPSAAMAQYDRERLKKCKH